MFAFQLTCVFILENKVSSERFRDAKHCCMKICKLWGPFFSARNCVREIIIVILSIKMKCSIPNAEFNDPR